MIPKAAVTHLTGCQSLSSYHPGFGELMPTFPSAVICEDARGASSGGP
jgi:hypothetical protein